MGAKQGTWVVVLAGGQGRRLVPLTRALYGSDLPKQFAVLSGDRSLLQQTVARAVQLAPAERVLVVVAAEHRALARQQLGAWRGIELVVQPRNLDTGPGILLPVARIRGRAPRARVTILPADHHFADDRPLLAVLRAAWRGGSRRRVTLVGVQPDRDETEYGWIVRGRRIQAAGPTAFWVSRFHEKPGPLVAGMLRARGALWNTFISTGPVSAFWRLARLHLPVHARHLDEYARHLGSAGEAAALAEAYARMPPASFSHDLLAFAAGLAVVPLAHSGWSDWGSPTRVLESLAGTPDHARLLACISAARAAPPLAAG